MNPVSDLLSRIFRGALKLVLVLAAMVFVLSFLLAVLVVSVWSLVTGRKPAPVVMFSRMREQSRQYTQGVWPGRTPPGDVVDVDATEVGERPGAGAPLQRLR